MYKMEQEDVAAVVMKKAQEHIQKHKGDTFIGVSKF